MAAFARSRISSRPISLALKSSNKQSIQSELSPSIPNPRSSTRRVSSISRLPLASSCLVTMLPLHSAIASARLRSVLSAESQSWGWIPQDELGVGLANERGDLVLGGINAIQDKLKECFTINPA